MWRIMNPPPPCQVSTKVHLRATTWPKSPRAHSQGTESRDGASPPTNAKILRQEFVEMHELLHIGRVDGPHCPVAAVLSFMVVRGNRQGPLCLWEDSKYLTRDCFMAGFWSALAAPKYTVGNYASHSFWIGATTTAAQCGAQDSFIKTRVVGEQCIYPVHRDHSGYPASSG